MFDKLSPIVVATAMLTMIVFVKLMQNFPEGLAAQIVYVFGTAVALKLLLQLGITIDDHFKNQRPQF